jgi:hypothetical protein
MRILKPPSQTKHGMVSPTTWWEENSNFQIMSHAVVMKDISTYMFTLLHKVHIGNIHPYRLLPGSREYPVPAHKGKCIKV